MSLALVAAHRDSREIPEGKVADKWQVYRDLCEGKGNCRHRRSFAGRPGWLAVVLSGRRAVARRTA